MLKAIGKTFKSMIKSLWQWIKKHWKEILLAIIIIILVVLFTVYVLPALKAFLSAKILAFDAWFGSKFGLAAGSFGLSKLFGIGNIAGSVIGARAGASLVGSQAIGNGIISKIIKFIGDAGGVIGENKKIIGGFGLAALFVKNKKIIFIALTIFIIFKVLGARRSRE